MIEAAAKAIFISFYTGDEPEHAWETKYTEAEKRGYRLAAKAAADAMRQATPEMKLAGARSIRDSMDEANYTQRSTACWQVMIDAMAAE